MTCERVQYRIVDTLIIESGDAIGIVYDFVRRNQLRINRIVSLSLTFRASAAPTTNPHTRIHKRVALVAGLQHYV